MRRHSYRARGLLRAVIACHRRQCRRVSGHYAAATGTRPRELELHDPREQPRWYRSSDTAERGFCAHCGSALLRRSLVRKLIGIWAGSLDEPTGVRLVLHIGVADAGDYYEPDPNVPWIDGRDHGIGIPRAPGHAAE